MLTPCFWFNPKSNDWWRKKTNLVGPSWFCFQNIPPTRLFGRLQRKLLLSLWSPSFQLRRVCQDCESLNAPWVFFVSPGGSAYIQVLRGAFLDIPLGSVFWTYPCNFARWYYVVTYIHPTFDRLCWTFLSHWRCQCPKKIKWSWQDIFVGNLLCQICGSRCTYVSEKVWNERVWIYVNKLANAVAGTCCCVVTFAKKATNTHKKQIRPGIMTPDTFSDRKMVRCISYCHAMFEPDKKVFPDVPGSPRVMWTMFDCLHSCHRWMSSANFCSFCLPGELIMNLPSSLYCLDFGKLSPRRPPLQPNQSWWSRAKPWTSKREKPVKEKHERRWCGLEEEPTWRFPKARG